MHSQNRKSWLACSALLLALSFDALPDDSNEIEVSDETFKCLTDMTPVRSFFVAFYEELLVDPTLLKRASQRANLDCDEMRYIAIGYGKFIQLIMLMKDGHVSTGVSRKAYAGELAARVQFVLQEHVLAWEPPKPWLLG